jgi:hypothetical protein
LYRIHPPIPLPYLLHPPTGITPQAGPVLLACSLILQKKEKKKWHFFLFKKIM